MTISPSLVLIPVLSIVAAGSTLAVAQDAPPPPPATVLHVTSRLITVDAVVHDPNGQPVHALDKGRFHIFEDGVEQKISSFEEHSSGEPALNKPLPPLPPHVYSNYPMVKTNNSVPVLLLDRLNTPVQEQMYAQKQMVSYLRQLNGSDKLAIFVLGSELRLLQGFSTDPSILLAALNNKKGDPGTPANGVQTQSDVDDPGFMVAQEGVANALDTLEQQQEAFQSDLRLQETLEAFQEIAAYLEGFPGRKSVIWFSGSFPVSLEPSDANAGTAAAQGTAITPNLYAREITRTMDMLSALQVAIYPVDVGGLQPPTAFSANQSKGGRNLGASMANDFQRDAAKHSGMNELAESTGGFATYNTNDLKGALGQIMLDNGNYYTLAYVPSNRNDDGGFRHIRLVVDGKKLNVSYRRGYYSDNPNQSQDTIAAVTPPGQDPTLYELATIMQRGAPDSTQILFKVKVAPVPQAEASAANPTDASAKNVITERIDWAIDLHAVSFQASADGHHHASLLLSAVAYDVNGKPLQADRERLLLDMDPEQYARAMRFGLQQHKTLQIAPGNIFLHLGILDVGSQNRGSTEIPMRVSPATQQPSNNP